MTWTIEAWAAVAAVALTLSLFLITRRNERDIRRAELVRALTQDFYQHENLRALFAEIDQGTFGGVGDPPGNPTEQSLVHLLDYLNTVGHSYVRGALRIEDLAGTTIGYMSFKVWQDDHVQSYLDQVRATDAEAEYAGAGFQHFYSLAAALDAWSRRAGGSPWKRSDVLHLGWRTALTRGNRYRPRVVTDPNVASNSPR